MKTRYLILILLISFISCTIYENRKNCLTNVELSIYPFGNLKCAIKVTENKKIIIDTITNNNKSIFLTLKKKQLPYSCVLFSDSWQYNRSNNIIYIKDKVECDSIFIKNGVFNFTKDSNFEQLRPNKNWCKLTINYENNTDSLIYRVESKWSGINLDDMSLIKNKYTYEKIGTNEINFNIPRQGDNSLLIKLYKNNTHLNNINIGQIMHDANYNWEQDSLEDFEINITNIDTKGNITINKWVRN